MTKRRRSSSYADVLFAPIIYDDNKSKDYLISWPKDWVLFESNKPDSGFKPVIGKPKKRYVQIRKKT